METQTKRPADNWKISRENTALIIVDMQNTWVHPNGSRYMPASEDIIPRISDLLVFARKSHVPVIHLYTTKRRDLADVGIFAQVKPQTHDPEDSRSNFEGTWGAEIYEPVKPLSSEIVIKKFRYSGFYSTQLESILRQLKRDTIAISGVATDVCCGNTARDGAMRDFKVVFLSDCNAAVAQEDHEATLRNFSKHFGLVMDSHSFMERLRD
jgi:ureidoacrylate peracid hydrolase